MMIRKVNKKSGFLIIVLILGILLMCVVPINAEGETALDAVSHLQSMLELDNVFTALSLWVGNFLYKCLSVTTNMVENAFDVITKMNLFQMIPQLRIFQSNLNQMLATVFILGLSGVVIARMLQRRETTSVLYNILIVGLMLVVFSSVTGLIHEGKNAFLSFSKAAIRSDAKTSELIFVKNTYDMKYLISEANNGNKSIITLHDQGFSSDKVKYLQFDERLSKDDLGYKYSLDSYTQELSGKRVNDGMFGYGDERYFRYHTDYALINITLLITVVVYLLAIIKGTFLTYDLVINELLGKIGVLKGLREIGDGAKPMLSMVQTSVSLIILTILMQLYSSVSISILAQSEQAIPWLVKMILLFVSGLFIVQGSDFLDNTFGFEGGRRTMLTTFMALKAGKSGLKIGKNAFSSGGEALGKGINAMNKFAEGGRGSEPSGDGGSNAKENSATDSSVEDNIDSPQNEMSQSKADSVPRPTKKKGRNIEDEVNRKRDGYKRQRTKAKDASKASTNTDRFATNPSDEETVKESQGLSPDMYYGYIPMDQAPQDVQDQYYDSKSFNEKVLDQYMKRDAGSVDTQVDSVPTPSKLNESKNRNKSAGSAIKPEVEKAQDVKPKTPKVIRQQPKQSGNKKSYVDHADVNRVHRVEAKETSSDLSNAERIKQAQQRMHESLFNDEKKKPVKKRSENHEKMDTTHE